MLRFLRQHDDQPTGGIFIPPKGEEPTMYDMYKDPEEIKASTAPRQESAAPSKYMGDSEDTEPGYILTPNGKTTYYT